FGSMEALFENTDKLKGKLKENVENFMEQGKQSKMLATILLDAPVEFDPEDLKICEPDPELLKEVFDELEFRNLAQRVFTDISVKEGSPMNVQGDLFDSEGEDAPAALKTIENTEHDYKMVDSAEKRKELITLLEKSKSFCFDTETTGIDAHQSELVGISFAVKPGEAWFVFLPENYNECHNIVQE
ncbi:MAG: DNA polymerase I, partial [Bacteroidales bacterium]|nr:DNA polymerase I [Bacteroidales bacterium]